MPAPTIEHQNLDLLDAGLYTTRSTRLWWELRSRPGLAYDQRNGLWAIARHRDVVEVERRAPVFVSRQGYRALWDPSERSMIAQDGAGHQRQRKHVLPLLSRRAVQEHRALILDTIDGLLRQVPDSSEFDVVEALAAPLPAMLTSALLGLDVSEWPRVKRWSEQLMRLDMRDRDGRVFADYYDANAEMLDLLKSLRAAEPGPSGLLGHWMDVPLPDGGHLSKHALLHELGLFVAGGSETTRTAIAHGLHIFCRHPDLWEELHEQPALVPGAVDEVLRWTTPLSTFFRRAIEDTELAGQEIARGERLILLLPSANADESVFADPERFDIRRDPNPHLAFGIGPHRCIGEHFARLDLVLLFQELTQRYTDLQMSSEPDFEPNLFSRSVRSLRLRWRER